MEKVAVITGSSSGIGFETALALAREGYYTYATMRDVTKSDKIKEIGQKENLKIDVLELDVDNENSAKTAIQQILDQKQRIDVLVNNAGWGLWGCVEDVSIDEFRAQFETNFLNPMKMAKRSESDTVYRDITVKVTSGVKMMAEMGTHPKEVADTIVKAIKNEKPLPRYIVGNDASMFLEARKNKTDIEFENYLKKELYGE